MVGVETPHTSLELKMTPLILKYPLDITGTRAGNKVPGEKHVLTTGVNRAFAPDYGAFYTKGLVIRDLGNGRILTKNTDYKATHLYTDATLSSGLEVCAVIVITNPSVSANIEIDYQVVGGPFASSAQVVQDLVLQLKLDNRAVVWGDIIGKPEDFEAAPHLHGLSDTYGFEYLTLSMESLTQAILVGDAQSHVELIAYFNAMRQDLVNYIGSISAQWLAHVTAGNKNPHGTDAGSINLGKVPNFAAADDATAAAGASKDTVLTPYGATLLFQNAAVGNPVTKIYTDRGNVQGALAQLTIELKVNRIYAVSVLLGGAIYTFNLAIENAVNTHRTAGAVYQNAYLEYKPDAGKLTLYSDSGEAGQIYGVREIGK